MVENDSFSLAIRNYLSADISGLPATRAQVDLIFQLILIVWSLHIIDWGLLQGALGQFLGLQPRRISGLVGIPFAHFFHANDVHHLVGNTLVFAPLGWAIAFQGIRLFYVVTIATALISGLGIWLFGRPSIHIGASGVIFGYFGFLSTYGLATGNLLSFLFALLVIVIYGSSVLFGIFPRRTDISWEGHVFGLLGGILTANWLSQL
jgi:membrane associated rhomboid family serine protease